MSEQGHSRPDRFLPIHQLQLFDLIYETRTVSRAAQLMQVSQPTASAWLAKLRRHFQDQLFVRAGGLMKPTPRADDLAPVVREAIEALRTLGSPSATFDPATSRREFRLECPDGTHLTILPRLLNQLGHIAPNVQINVSSLTEAPEEDLRNDRIDLAVTLASPTLKREFRTQPVVDQGWLCLTRAGHPLTDLDPDTYREAHHVDITHSGWSSILHKRLETESWQRHVTLTMPGVLGLPELLASTDLIVTLPEQIARALSADRRVRTRPCPLQLPTFTVSMYWSHRHDADPGLRWLRELLTRSFPANLETVEAV